MPSAGHGEQRTRRTEEAIAALLTYPTIREAAASIGVNETTLIRWLNEPTFKAEYQRARHQVLESALTKLQVATGKAVDTLVKLLDGDSPNAACRAAALILEHAQKAQEWIDLTGRVEQLEASLPRTVLPGAPPHKLDDRVRRLEIHVPAGCEICQDGERLAAAFLETPDPNNRTLCPSCGAAPSSSVALHARMRVVGVLYERREALRLSG
jgi:hypothetical protein